MAAVNNSSLLDNDSTGNFTSSTSPLSLGDNLLANPGFEDAISGSPNNRTISRGTETIAVDATTKTGGYQSLKMTSTGGLAAWGTSYVPVVPGASYNLSTDILTGSNSSAVLRVYWFKDSSGTTSATQNTGDLSVTTNGVTWGRKATRLPVPSDAAYAKIEVAVNNNGTAW